MDSPFFPLQQTLYITASVIHAGPRIESPTEVRLTISSPIFAASVGSAWVTVGIPSIRGMNVFTVNPKA